MKNYKNYIDGKFVKSHGTVAVEVFNPANQKLIGSVPDSSAEDAEDVEDAVAAATRAQPAVAL